MSKTVKTPRVRRGRAPPGQIRRHNYREKALAALRRDFADRCAYSMAHMSHAGGVSAMDVDHFDPATKSRDRQEYGWLYLASHHCNLRKGDTWPTAAERRQGLRFLDCCAEQDYGVHLFEDSASGRLVATSRAGVYHLRHLGLNADHLVEQRRLRSKALAIVRALMAKPTRTDDEERALAHLESLLRTAIPPIPPPPA